MVSLFQFFLDSVTIGNTDSGCTALLLTKSEDVGATSFRGSVMIISVKSQSCRQPAWSCPPGKISPIWKGSAGRDVVVIENFES